MRCRYDRDQGEYLVDGKPCKRDDYGDPTYHCTARRTCSNHVGKDELTCHGCVSSVRTAIARILDLLSLAEGLAVHTGRVDREANAQAGPAAHPVPHWWRRVNARTDIDRRHARGDLTGASWVGLHAALAADDDDQHAATLLTTWHAMLAEDYGHDLPERMTAVDSAGYLDRHLAKVAQDPWQDFPLLMREVRACASRLEVAVRDSTRTERGVPCPECVADEAGAPRLVRHFGHWCDEQDCEQIHYDDDSGDVWTCPRNPAHEWTHERYESHVRPRQAV